MVSNSFVVRHALKHIARRTCPHGGKYEFVTGEGRQHHCPRTLHRIYNLATGPNAGESRDADVENHDIGLEGLRAGDSFYPCFSLANDLEVLLPVQKPVQSFPHNRVIVGDQDADRFGCRQD